MNAKRNENRLSGGVTTVNNTNNVCLVNDVFIIDKNYVFQPTVAIIIFYPKSYAKKKECWYSESAWISVLKQRGSENLHEGQIRFWLLLQHRTVLNIMRKTWSLDASEMMHLLLLAQLVESRKRMKATEWLYPAA